MKRIIALFIFVVTVACAEPDAGDRPRELVLNGQTFHLVNSKSDGLVTSFEYALAGEKYEDWTQLLTHQVIGLTNPVTAEQFAAFFQRKLKDDDPKASMEIIQSFRKAVVFQVRFPRTEGQDDQVMVCLAFPDTKHAQMNVIQYALKPNRLSGNLAELQLKSWQGMLCAKATVAQNRE